MIPAQTALVRGLQVIVMTRTKEKRKLRTGRKPHDSIARLTAALASKNGVERQHAREALVQLGESAVPPLIAALQDERERVRWEAAKAFTALHAPAAAPALARTLADKDGDVRWLAAEALVGLRDAALVPLLETLTTHAGSTELCQGAHHVLRTLNRGDLAAIVGRVLTALEHCEPELVAPVSAEVALEQLKQRAS